jgi:Na+/H+ antiporter NhaD/arsenite permease-like protein
VRFWHGILASLRPCIRASSPPAGFLGGVHAAASEIRKRHLSGAFEHLSGWVLNRIRNPFSLLIVTVMLSGVLLAFLINDIVCLALTPLVLHLTRQLRCDPLPHLIALGTAANIGSVGTITGNPQNIYIGSHSGIPYLRFAVRLFPVAALGLVLNSFVVAFVYRRSLVRRAEQMSVYYRADEMGGV